MHLCQCCWHLLTTCSLPKFLPNQEFPKSLQWKSSKAGTLLQLCHGLRYPQPRVAILCWAVGRVLLPCCSCAHLYLLGRRPCGSPQASKLQHFLCGALKGLLLTPTLPSLQVQEPRPCEGGWSSIVPLLACSYTIRWLQENIHRQKCLEFHRCTPCTPTSLSTIPWGKFPGGCKEAFSASACMIVRTWCCRTCWETALCLPTPSPVQFTCAVAMMGRSIAGGPPVAEVADCSMLSISACLRKKRKDNEEAVGRWEICGGCSHLKFLQI